MQFVSDRSRDFFVTQRNDRRRRITLLCIEKELERKRNEAAGENPSPLERLLDERVALCWLAANYVDAEYVRKLKVGMSFREGEYLARRCEHTNRQLDGLGVR